MELIQKSILFERNKDPKRTMGISKLGKIKRDVEPYMKWPFTDINDLDHLLIITAENNFLKYVKYLIKSGANIHAGTDDALRYASENGHLDVVKYLVESGADIHSGDDEVLRWASECGHLNVVKYLVESGADIHASDDYPLQWASKKRSFRCC